MRTLICLSSAFRVKYAKDMVRVMALPSGTGLRFRYRPDWVHEEVGGFARSRPGQVYQTLVAYVENHDGPKQGAIVPARWAAATLETDDGDGEVRVRLVLGAWVRWDGGTPHQVGATVTLPVRIPDKKDKLSGDFIHFGEVSEGVVESDEVKDWRATVEALAGLPGLTKFPSFLRVDLARDGQRAAVVDRSAAMTEELDYTLTVCHYQPDEHRTAFGVVTLESAGTAALGFNDDQFKLGSPQDAHDVRVRPGGVKWTTPGRLKLKLSVSPTGPSSDDWESEDAWIEVPIDIRVSPTIHPWASAGIAVGLAAVGGTIVGVVENTAVDVVVLTVMTALGTASTRLSELVKAGKD